MVKKILLTVLFLISLPMSAFSTETENNWGLAVGIRSANIPFKAKDDRVDDVIPLIFYDSDLFFIRGLTGGMKLYNRDEWQFSILGRYRFFDIPKEFQNLAQGGGIDIGGQLKYRVTDNLETNIELLSDSDSRYYSELNVKYHWEQADWELLPYGSIRYKSERFNDHYYGLDGFQEPNNLSNTFSNKIGSGFDFTIGTEVRYHLLNELYLLGRAQITAVDSNTRDSVSIDNGVFGEVFLGIAFFDDKKKKRVSTLDAKPYIRVSHGWATPSNLGEILSFDMESDRQNNQLTSIFYGHPIADSLFGIEEIDLYITTGFVYHHGSDSISQNLKSGEGININDGNNKCSGVSVCTLNYDRQPANEYVLAIKAFYNFYWPIHWRLGLAEGLSYIDKTSNIEQRDMDRKGYRSSKLMNYIDVTLDFSLGEAIGVKKMDDLYLGAGIHHRSSIFESSSAFGRIKGGSNYGTVYLQYHY